ncbi:MAG: PIG-L family deacetylase [Chitinophagales bacterium]|nr:PIG-L family deacetylase [Chitinophagales bacterium]
MQLSFKNILVLAPHTDDGELGAGATINRLVDEGATVHYVAFSICAQSLPAGLAPDTLAHECSAATQILGIKKENLTLLDYDVRYFPENRQPILEDLVKLNKKIQPDLVLLPNSQDIHQDHQTIHQESVRAFKNTTIWGYELPWNNTSFSGNTFVTVSEQQLHTKIEALTKYYSQSHRSYMNADFIRGLAMVRGIQAGSLYAEAFEFIRMKI